MDSTDIVISTALGAVIGAVALYTLQRLPAVRQRFRDCFRRFIRSLNAIRKFFLATKRTRFEARAAYLARRPNISLRRLRRTLFHWYEEMPELWPHLVKIHAEHDNELVSEAAARLLWVDKRATELQPGDIVRINDNSYRHVVHITWGTDGASVVWDATHRSSSLGGYSRDAQVKVTRRGWCPVAACRYCQMGPDLTREIGEWWFSREEAQREANRLRRGGSVYHIGGPEDVESAFDGLNNYDAIAKRGGRLLEAPEHYDYEPILSAQSVAELRMLASEGWTFDVLVCRGYDELPKVIVSRWCPPLSPL